MELLYGAVGAGGLIGLLRWRASRRLDKKLTQAPLAGFDTGARSPYRTPKGVRFHKGL